MNTGIITTNDAIIPKIKFLYLFYLCSSIYKEKSGKSKVQSYTWLKKKT